MKIPIYQIDAFTNRIFAGNPAAVCPLDAWLEKDRMQAIDQENTKQGYTVTFPEVEKLHHQRSYELDPLIVIVGSPDLSGFKVKYRIFCDFPGTVERELNFRISYKQNE